MGQFRVEQRIAVLDAIVDDQGFIADVRGIGDQSTLNRGDVSKATNARSWFPCCLLKVSDRGATLVQSVPSFQSVLILLLFCTSLHRTRSWHAVADDPAPIHCIIRPACLSPLAQSWAHTKFNQSSDRAAWARFTAPVTRVSIARSL